MPEDQTQKRPLSLIVVSVALLTVGIASFVLALQWRPRSAPGKAWHEFFVQLWPFTLTTFAALCLYEFNLRRFFLRELKTLSGPSVVDALQPAEVLGRLLRRVYGNKAANEHVVAGVLGGSGSQVDGRDLTISTRTVVEHTLAAINADDYSLSSRITYTFKEPVDEQVFVIFATHDALLRDAIVLGCERPLFDLWYFPDSSSFDQSLSEIIESLRIGISYLDDRDFEHSQPPQNPTVRPMKVAVSRFPEFLRQFRENVGGLKKLSVNDYKDSLAIIQCRLDGLTATDPYASVRIVALTVESKTIQKTADRHSYWSAPYPCYVESVAFDIAAFDASREWEFRLVPFVLRSEPRRDVWCTVRQLEGGKMTISVRSWVLPGHGVALIWKAPLEGRKEADTDSTDTDPPSLTAGR